ncbi:MAG TPA: hypothetical protein VHA75_07130, partial [Rugosimonospora sp.]|nr:hypothetical protein [Rugosimonospora sp.]
SMIATVRAGASAGEIREDVAQDLENVLGQLRQQVMSGQAVDYGWWSGTLRTKVAQRASEHAITDSYAQRLLSDVDALSHSTT